MPYDNEISYFSILHGIGQSHPPTSSSPSGTVCSRPVTIKDSEYVFLVEENEERHLYLAETWLFF